MLKIVNIAEMIKKIPTKDRMLLKMFYSMKGGRSTATSFTATYDSQPIVRENQFD